VDALAYAVGRHVVFTDGRYQPQTQIGRQLLAHELGHVVQQSSLSDTLPASSARWSGGLVLQRASAQSPTPGPETDLDKIRAATRTLAGQLETAKARRKDQHEINDKYRATSWTSEVVGGLVRSFKGKGLHALNIPGPTIWVRSDLALGELKKQLERGDAIRAAHALKNFSDEFY
jgi:Domain of unknown function (DUF4157)